MYRRAMNRSSLTPFAWLSIAAAVLTIALKATAYFLTGSVGLLSDALESLVNLAGALMALAMLTIAAQPEDDEHSFGHSKAEYFSSGVEGSLILVAAVSIAWTALQRLLDPKPLEQVGIGLGVSLLASVINFVVARILLQAAQRNNSITLQASSQHLMTDVWTSIGVLVGVGAVVLTGWVRLDPIIAILVAVNIIWSGVRIVRESVLGLMDTAIPFDEQARLKKVLEKYADSNVQFHALRTRQSGARRFISIHVIVPGHWTVQSGHQFLEQIESEIRLAIPASTVLTHLESMNDPSSWEDVCLDRTIIANELGKGSPDS